MKRRYLSVFASSLLLLGSAGATAGQSAAPAAGLKWRGWDEAVFREAKRDHKFVLLDLEAVWCHWCHVMDANTYSDKKVIALLEKKYITVKVDQDSRPDLSNRYEDYGWPATVVFDEAGQEIVKRQGYLTPEEMASMLEAIIADPSPGPSVEPERKIVLPKDALLTPALREAVTKNFYNGYDEKHGSWGMEQKLLDWDSVEYAMDLARLEKNTRAEHMAKETLAEQLHLLDPAWGGVYQYSTDGDWNAPHFEKIMQMQAENLRMYSLGYAKWGDRKYLHAAEEIRRYLETFLMAPTGAFYTSQDADLVEGKHSADYFALSDQERRKRGVPRVDKHVYTRENGWAINGLATLYSVTGEKATLEEASRAAGWVIAHRAIAGGGFVHGGTPDEAGPYLGDTIAMTRAFLTLYGATGDRNWLRHARDAAGFIGKNFRDTEGGGFLTAKATNGGYLPKPQRDENVMVARTANLLFHYTGDAKYREMAKDAMRYLAAKPVVERLPASSVLLADLEMGSEPLHLTVVGHKEDLAAQKLFAAAMKYPVDYKRLEWWDTREGRLPNPDVEYPELTQPAAFVCTSRTCSPPIFDAEKLAGRVDTLLAAR